VFQNSLEVFNPILTIGEQIIEPIKNHTDLSSREAGLHMRHLLELTGLDPEWADGYPHQMSGGMRQRALIAMAISCDPEFLIIDEPTTSLDPQSRNSILQLIRELQKKIGFSLIMISHNLAALREMTSRVVTMCCGQIVEQGITTDVMRNPMHCYTRGLLDASADFFKYKDLWGIKDTIAKNTRPKSCIFYSRCCQSEENCKKQRPNLQDISAERKVACHKGGIETLLSAHGIQKTYRFKNRTIPAVKGADLKIKSGEIVALIGKSGSGKSTLAHMLVNIFSPDKGEIIFMGKKVNGFEITKKMGGMQIVFQDPFSSTSHRMRVLDIVKEPLNIIKWKTQEDRNMKSIAAISIAGLPCSEEFLQRYSHTLSGGQRQRLSMARALVTNPKLLIADEVTSMLDPSTIANMLRELKGLQNMHGFSMLYITHDFHLARKIANRAYVMSEGSIVESGPAFEIFERPVHPVTISLMSSSFGNRQSL
ncbi:MAG: ABC transporter ATP-binding protein, partial [Desulfobacteraceae bacterium]|nr:ABC transporter ATP-binding protein [Desulfobacteraceae bacterium]